MLDVFPGYSPRALTALGPVLAAQSGGEAVVSTQALLVIAALLSATLIVLAIFTLWQSHRTYLETVRLHQRMSEAQQAFLSRMLQTGPDARPRSVAPRRSAPAAGARASVATASPPTVPSCQPEAAGAGARNGRRLDELTDVEFAVLEKLAQDPAFFTRNPLEGFGASQLTVSSLIQRGLVRLDGLGRPAVPEDVQAAVRACLPRS